MKIKRSPWIICQQEGGLKPLNRWLAEKKFTWLSFWREKEEAGWSKNYQEMNLFLSTPDKVSFIVVPLHHSVSSCDCCFREEKKFKK